MDKNEFKLNEYVDLIVYNYDNNGTEYTKVASGKVCQITNDFIVINNGKYKESYKYVELCSQKHKDIKGEPYDLSIDNYMEDIITQCLKQLNKKGKGSVFTKEQVENVIERAGNGKYNVRTSNGIYIIEKNKNF